jgi:hypothetical protein
MDGGWRMEDGGWRMEDYVFIGWLMARLIGKRKLALGLCQVWAFVQSLFK